MAQRSVPSFQVRKSNWVPLIVAWSLINHTFNQLLLIDEKIEEKIFYLNCCHQNNHIFIFNLLNNSFFHSRSATQPAIICSKITIETLEQSAKYVHRLPTWHLLVQRQLKHQNNILSQFKVNNTHSRTTSNELRSLALVSFLLALDRFHTLL